MKKRRTKKGDPFLIAFGIYGALGFQLAISVVLFLLLGNYLDEKWDTSPWLTLLGLIIGTTGGFYNLIKILIWNQRRKDKLLHQWRKKDSSQ